MVAQPLPQLMSVTEWRELERTSHDAKHEYIDGQVYLMAGGSRNHARIAENMIGALDGVLDDGGPCIAYNSDVAVRLSETRYTYPDITVTCDERDQATDETEVVAPRVIVEVLSDSTEAYDRGRKFSYYRACPTVEEYVLIATRYQAVEVFRRTRQGWAIYQSYEPGDEIELASIGVRITFSALYRRTSVPAATDAPEGEI